MPKRRLAGPGAVRSGAVVLVASAGGHLSELVRLRRRLLPDEDVVFVVPDTDQSETLLRDEQVVHVPLILPREWRQTLALSFPARRLLRDIEARSVISTGAAPALPFLVAASSLGVPAHYVESLTRLDAPSMTGRILARVPGVTCHSPHAERGWDGWESISSPVDDFAVVERPDPEIRRVVVSLGTMRDFGFRSLIEQLVEILPSDADVLWQTGVTDTDGLGIDAEAWVPIGRLRTAMEEADVVIGHAGCGTALDALDAGRVPILVPRRAHRGEHVDDHQVDIAHWLDGRGLAIGRDVEELGLRDLLDAAAQTSVQRPGAADTPPALSIS